MTPTTDAAPIWREGFRASEDADGVLGVIPNPYTPDDPRFIWWRRGWNAHYRPEWHSMPPESANGLCLNGGDHHGED